MTVRKAEKAVSMPGPPTKALRTILKTCLALQPNERLSIVCHESLAEMGEALWASTRRTTRHALLVKYLRQGKNGTPLNDSIHALIRNSDACVVLTPDFLDEADFKGAQTEGARVVLVQRAATSMLDRALNGNLFRVCMRSRKLVDLFAIGKKLELTSPSGTRLQLALRKGSAHAQTGLANSAGQVASIPAGEASVILDHNVSGKVALDRIAGSRRRLAKSVVLHVQKGRITQIKGQKDAESLRKKLRKFGNDGRTLHEFGVGTNSAITLGHSAAEDEKAGGTVHISFGPNLTTRSQGKMLPAVKGIILYPTLTLDCKPIIKDGEFLV